MTLSKEGRRVPRRYLLQSTNKPIVGVQTSTANAHRSPRTKFDDSITGRRRGLLLDLNEIPTENEETLQSPLNVRGGNKNLLLDLNDISREEKEKALESLLADILRRKINERLSPDNVVTEEEEEEEAQEPPFDDGSSDKNLASDSRSEPPVEEKEEESTKKTEAALPMEDNYTPTRLSRSEVWRINQRIKNGEFTQEELKACTFLCRMKDEANPRSKRRYNKRGS